MRASSCFCNPTAWMWRSRASDVHLLLLSWYAHTTSNSILSFFDSFLRTLFWMGSCSEAPANESRTAPRPIMSSGHESFWLTFAHLRSCIRVPPNRKSHSLVHRSHTADDGTSGPMVSSACEQNVTSHDSPRVAPPFSSSSFTSHHQLHPACLTLAASINF